MYYKNYSIGYSPDFDETTIIKYDIDMTNFKDSDFNRADHIIGFFNIDTYKFKNYQNYLDENGLFMGIFPSEVIENSFVEAKEKEEKEIKRRQVYLKESLVNPINEDIFKWRYERGASLQSIIKFINSINKSNLSMGGYEFPIEEYYKDILVKYWGDYRFSTTHGFNRGIVNESNFLQSQLNSLS